MVLQQQVSRRTGSSPSSSSTGSAFIRLLSRLDERDVRESRQSFSDRLSQWLGWTDAIALSATLSAGVPSATTASTSSSGVEAPSAEAGQCARVRSAAAQAIAEDMRAIALEAHPDDGFAPYRRRYVARQQAMAASIEPLRARLRETLAVRSPAMAKLAEIDAVMERVLAPHEHRLLATVPALLDRHFKRLRRQAEKALADASNDDNVNRDENNTAPDSHTDAWREAFGKDMHNVLLAELDIRLQPAQALLEALRAARSPQDSA